MFIYKTTCLLNGKIYVGQCTRDKDREYFGSGTLIIRAIGKYGVENFVREIIKDNISSQEELDIWEKIMTIKFKSNIPEIGYNILIGSSNKFISGSPMKNPKIVEKVRLSNLKYHRDHPEVGLEISKRMKERMSIPENRKRISDKLKSLDMSGENNPNFGNYWSEEQKQNLRNKKIGKYIGSDNSNYGNKMSDENKMKLSNLQKIKMKGSGNPMYGKLRITNGLSNSIIGRNEELPHGFKYGMTRGLRIK